MIDPISVETIHENLALGCCQSANLCQWYVYSTENACINYAEDTYRINEVSWLSCKLRLNLGKNHSAK
jgi:hypothetical protein